MELEHVHRVERTVEPPVSAPTVGEQRLETPHRARRTADVVVQTKLQVGAADDPHEREADRVAAEVVGRLQRRARLADDHGAHEVSTRADDHSRSDAVRRSTVDDRHGPGCRHCAGLELAAATAPVVRRRIGTTTRPHAPTRVRRSADAGAGTIGLEGGPLDGGTESAIRRARGGGRPLGADVRRQMESGFAADFSAVRVHDGSTADDLNRRLQATAFTAGNDIFFRRGRYEPTGPAGQELLAHELTHVVQQGGAPVARRVADDVTVNQAPMVVRRALDVTALRAAAKSANSSMGRFKKSSMEPVLKLADAFNAAPNALSLALLKTEVDVLASDKAQKYDVSLSQLDTAMKSEMRSFLGKPEAWASVRDAIRASEDETDSCFGLVDTPLDKGKVLYRLGGTKDWKQQAMATFGISHNDSREALVQLGVFETGTAGHKEGPEVDELISTKLTKFVENNLESRGRITGRVAVVGADDWDVIGEEQYGAATWNGGKRATLNAFVDRSSDPPRVFVNKDRGNAGTAIHEACHMWGDPGRPINGISHALNEGVTEYFARKVCNSLSPKIPRTVYAKEFNIANKLVQTIGEDVVGRAFFDGDVASMAAKLGATRWANFVTHVNAGAWANAEKVLEKVAAQAASEDDADTSGGLAELFG